MAFIKTHVTADIVDTHLYMDVQLTAKNSKPFVAVYNPDLPIDDHHIKFHGSITKEIMKLVMSALHGKIKKEVHKALTETIPNEVNI